MRLSPSLCRLNLRYCWSEQAAAAVQALTQASGLEHLSLCIASGDGREDAEEQGQPASSSDSYYSQHDIEVPPLTCLATVLTELRLLCGADLPTDVRRLRNLRRLHVHRSLLDGIWLPYDLARLRKLTMLRIDAQPPGGCRSISNLKSLFQKLQGCEVWTYAWQQAACALGRRCKDPPLHPPL